MAVSTKNVRIEIGGSSIPFNDEPTVTSDNKVYKLSDNSKRLWDYTVPVTVKVDGVAVTDGFRVKFEDGIIVFDVSEEREVTVSGKYITTSIAATARSYDYTLTAEEKDVTTFLDSHGRYIGGLKQIEGTMEDFSIEDEFFLDSLINDDAVFIRINRYENDPNPRRFWAKISEEQLTGDVTDLQTRTISFKSVGAF